MANYLSKDLNQTAVYWSPGTKTGFGGQATYAIGTEISCRWEQKQELFIDATGEEVRSNAVVIVSQDVAFGGWLYLGTLDSIASGSQSAPNLVDAFPIRAFTKIPDMKGENFRRVAWL